MNELRSSIIPFPFDAQSSPFFCALASVLILALGYTEETPYFCGPKDSFCVDCGDCAGKTALQKHHLKLYHNYQTFTGIGLGWEWPENDSPYQVIPCWQQGWRWPDEFFSMIFGYAGLSWKRLVKGADQSEVYACIKASIDARLPALLRLGMDWRVVIGYDENGRLIGLGYQLGEAAVIPDWHDTFEDAVIVTGRTNQTVKISDVLSRMIQTLSHPNHASLEADLMARLDGITTENVWETAEWLNHVVSFPIEARWHAAESELFQICENPAAKQKIFGMIRQYVFDGELDATHGTCWKIWGQLGVGPKTGYKLSANAGELLLNPAAQAELKRLFAIVFENDHAVLQLLREAVEIIGSDCGK